MTSDWLKGSLLLMATLSAGIAIGMWYERSQVTVHAGEQSGVHSAPTGANHEQVMQALHHSLKLDSTQHSEIMATLHRHQLLVDSAWGALRPHVHATLDSTHSEIMNILRPDQREVFQRMVGHMHGSAPHR